MTCCEDDIPFLCKIFSIEQDFGCLNIIDYFEGGNAVVKLLNGLSHQDG